MKCEIKKYKKLPKYMLVNILEYTLTGEEESIGFYDFVESDVTDDYRIITHKLDDMVEGVLYYKHDQGRRNEIFYIKEDGESYKITIDGDNPFEEVSESNNLETIVHSLVTNEGMKFTEAFEYACKIYSL